MNIKLLLILLLSISLTSAFYSGEIIIIPNELNLNDLDWTIIDNTTEITILPEIKINQTNITIFFPYDMPPNNFKIVFIEPKTKEVIKEVKINTGGGGGGGSSTKYVDRNIIQPLFLDRNITIEKEIPVEKEVNITIYKEPEKNKLKDYSILGGSILLGILLGLVLKRRKKNTEESNYY